MPWRSKAPSPRPVGTIEIDRRAASTGLIDLGKTGAKDGALRLDAAEVALFAADRLVIGRESGGPTIQITEALTITAVPEVRLQTSALTISKLAGLTLPSAGLLDIRTDTVTLSAAGDGTRLSVPGGTIAITPRAADRAVVLGATEAGKLGISAELLDRIGSDANPTKLLLVTAAGEQGITLGGDVRLGATDGSTIRVETLRLVAAGAGIAQSAGVLVGGAIEVAAGGDVTLTRAGNAFDRLSGAADGDLAALSTRTLTLGDIAADAIAVGAAALTLDGLLDAATVGLTTTGTAPASGGILQTASGRIGAADATVELEVTATGGVALDAAGQNRLSSLVLSGAAAQPQSFASVTGLTVTGSGGAVGLAAPDIAFKAFTAAGNLTLVATGTEGAGGGITQSKAIGVGGTLAATALRAVLLDDPANTIGALGAITAGTGTVVAAEQRIVIRSAGSGGNPVVGLDGKLSVPTGGTIALGVDGLALGADGALSAPGGTVFLAPNTAGRHVALGRRDPGDLPDPAPAPSGELRLSATLLSERTTASRLEIGRLPDGKVTAGTIRHYGADIGLSGFGTVALASTGFIRQRGLTLAEAEGDGPGGADGQRGALALSALELRAGGDVWLGADNKIGALALAQVGGTLTLRQAAGTALAVTGPVAAVNRMTLIADTLSIDVGQRLSVPGGSIELLPRTQGRAVALGTSDPGELSLDGAALGRIGDADAPTGRLRVGASDDAAAAGLAGWGTDFAIGLTDAGLAGGGRTAGTIFLDLPVTLRPRIGGLDLVGGGVFQNSGAALDVARLSLDMFGAVRMQAPGNRVDRLATASGTGAAVRVGRTAGSGDDAAFRFLTGGTTPLVIDGDVVALYAPGGADPATGGLIDITAPALDIRGDLTTSLPAGAILDAGAVRTDTGLVRLQATTGGITQQAETGITAARFAAFAAGAITLDSTGNLILAVVPMGVLLPDGTAAALPGAAVHALGGDVVLATRLNPAAGLAAADRALVVDGSVVVPAGVITGRIADAGAIEAGGVAAGDFLGTGTGFRIRLVADDMALRADLVAPGGEVVLDQAGTTPGWEAVRFRARTDETEQGLFLEGAELGRVVLDGATVAPDVDPFGLAGGGRLTLSSSGDFLLTESLVLPGVGELRLEAPDGSIIQQGGTIEVRALSAHARDSITLDLPGNAVARLRDIHALTGDVTLRVGSVAIAGIDAQPNGLLAPGRDTLDGATGAGGALRITGTSAGRGIEAGPDGTITLRADDLDIRAALLAPGGAVRLLPLSAGRNVTLGDAAQGSPALGMFLSAAELARVDVGADGLLAIGAVGATPTGRITFGSQALDFGRAADGAQAVGRLDLAASVFISQTAGSLRVEELSLALDTANRRPIFIDFGSGFIFPIADTSPARIALAGENAIGQILGASLRVDPAFPGAGTGHNTILLRQAAGEALDIAGPVALTQTGGRITLVADALTLGADVTAPSAPDADPTGATAGRIEILPRTAGTAISLGTATGGLELSAAELARLSTGGGLLRIGRSADALAAGLSAGGITLGGALDLTGVAAQLELYAGMQGATPGTITQTGALTVARLAGEAAGGITLDDPANRIGALAPREVLAGGDTGQSLRAGTADADAPLTVATAEPLLRVDAAVQAGTAGGRLTLRADDMAIAAPLRAPGGTVHLAPLTADGTQAVRLGSAGTGGALHLSGEELRRAEAGTLEVGLAGATPGSGSGPLTLEADIDLRDAPGSATPFAAPRVRELRIATGTAADGTGLDATQTAGRLNVEALSGDVAGSVLLDATGNPINIVRGLSAGGDVALRFGGVADGFGGLLPPAIDGAGNPLVGTAAPVIAADPARQGATADQFGLRAGAGREVRITTDGLVITPIAGDGAPATLQAPGGTVRLSAAAAGRVIVLGGTFASTLSLSTETLAAIGGSGAGGTTDPVARLRIGGTTAGPIVVNGPVELREAPLPDGTPGAERVQVLELASGGVIVGDGTMRVGGFAATGTTVDLTAPHQVARLAQRTDDAGALLPGGLVATTGVVRFSTGTPFTISEDVQAFGAVTLGAAGDLTVATGTQVTSGGELRLEAGGGLTIEGALQAVGAMRLTALGDGAVLAILGGPIEAGGTLFLLAPSGSITQAAAGRILVGRIDVAAGAGILLDPADNTVTVVERAESADGDIRIRVLGALQIAGTVDTSGEVRIEAGGDLALGGATVTGGSVALDAGGAVALGAARVTATAGDLVADGGTGLTADGATLGATGEIRLTSDAALSLLRSIVTAGGLIELGADGALTLSGTSLDGASLRALAGGALDATGITVTATGEARIATTGGDLALAGAAVTGGSVALEASGGVALGAARITATAGDLVADAGTGLVADGATLGATGEIRLTSGAALALLRSVVTAGGAIELGADGTLTLSGTNLDGASLRALAGGALDATGITVTATGEARIATTGGDLSLGGAAVTGGSVALEASGGVALGAARITATAGDLVADAGTGLVADGATLGATGEIRLTSGAALALLRSVVTAGGAIELGADGTLTLSGTNLDGASLRALAGGDVTLTDATVTVADGARIASGGGLAATNLVLAAEEAELVAGGVATLSGLTATIGRAILVAGPGGIVMAAPGTLRPGGELLPIALFDTRTGGFQAIPDVAAPDTPGVLPQQQTTQVLRPDTSGGARTFGVSVDAPAGNVALALDAGLSPVFLLVDAGSVAGDIIAGRLGIHGVGGDARLFGSLGGFPGQAAARFGDVTRFSSLGIVTPSVLSRYRINECVISSLNCVNPNLVILLPTPPPPLVDLVTDILARDPDAVLPNVAEEEF
jgi:hypothetical protein